MIFYKTVAAGNDFLHINSGVSGAGPEYSSGQARGRLAVAMCRRNDGAGADGVIFYTEGAEGVAFEIYNRDGSSAELSGNGMTGLCAVLCLTGEVKPGDTVVLHSPSGIKRHRFLERQGARFRFIIEIGPPDFHNTLFFPFLERDKRLYTFQGVSFYPVSVGNPHIVVFPAPKVSEHELGELGQMLSQAEIFPRQTNVEFVTRLEGNECSVFYFERGAGFTSSSSTGSSAVFALLRVLGLAEDRLTVRAAGGTLELSGKDSIYLDNSAQVVYKGIYMAPSL